MSEKGIRKQRVGVVLRDKMAKTVIVEVERLVKHPRYNRYVKERKKYFAHDENSECKVGDKVLLMESRPLSKLKRWRVSKILKRRVSAES